MFVKGPKSKANINGLEFGKGRFPGHRLVSYFMGIKINKTKLFFSIIKSKI